MITTTDKNGIFAVFDVGSNSVRALVRSEDKTYFQGLETTRLGEKLDEKKELTPVAVERTVKGIEKLLAEVKKFSPQRIFAFATEAVRSAKNGSAFVDEVKNRTGLTVEIIGGEEEGEIGLSGAVGSGDGGIIDIGGASAEIAAQKGGKTVYCHSLPLGAVRLKDLCGEDEEKLRELIDERIKEYGELPKNVPYYAVGGTATAFCACFLGLEKYDREKVNGTEITREQIRETYEKIKNATYEERVKTLKISEKRAEIIVGGAYLLLRIVSEFGIDKITVSENDNMLGFLIKRGVIGRENYGTGKNG